MTTREDSLTVDEVITAWTEESDRRRAKNEEAAQRGLVFSDTALALLARGKPVSTEDVVRTSGLTLAIVEEIFAEVEKRGGEFDEAGNLVGLALTLNPTPHRFLLDDRTLYTWCSLDAIFLPRLLERTAKVESTCPVTGAAIRLTVRPEGVVDYQPATTVLSITVPGLSCRRKDDPEDELETGPSSDSCGQCISSPAAKRANAGLQIIQESSCFRLRKPTNWRGPIGLSGGNSSRLNLLPCPRPMQAAAVSKIR